MATLILKTTEKCNSNCIYCDVKLNKQHAKQMPLDLLEVVYKRINEYLLAVPEDDMLVIWHGGEPLLNGVEYFEAAHAFQEEICSATKSRIQNAIQSNITLMSEEFIHVLKKMGINRIGTSYDPEPGIRGTGSKRDSDHYNRMFFNGLNLLKKNDVRYGIIYVVTRKSLKDPLGNFIFLSNLCNGFNMNPVLLYDDERSDLSITPEEYVEFLGAIFPYWWEHKERFYDVVPFISYTKIFRDRDIRLAYVDSGNCANSHVMIAPDGESSQCGRSSDWNLLPYGNITEKSFCDIFNDSQRKELLKRNDLLFNSECKGCEYWKICHGGCPLDAYAAHKGMVHKTSWCMSNKLFLEKYFIPITGLTL